MKKTLVKYRELRDKILALELDIALIEKDINKVDADVARLKSVEKELQYNIDFLKNEAKITVAMEYKRSLLQLEEIKKSILKYVTYRSKEVNKLQQRLETYDFYFKEYETAHARLEGEQVILSFEKYKKDRDEQERQGQSEEENPR